jgi:hypothetical protein
MLHAAFIAAVFNSMPCCSVTQVQKSKAGTGRVVGFRELGLVNAYTMEASFAGAAVGKHAKQHFNTGGKNMLYDQITHGSTSACFLPYFPAHLLLNCF